ADDAGVLGLGEHGVTADVAVVLVGDPGLVAQVRAGDQPQQRRAQVRARGRAGQVLGPVGLEGVLPVGAGVRAVVGGAVVRDAAGRHVADHLVVPGDDQPVGVGDLADHGGLDVPLGADLQE